MQTSYSPVTTAYNTVHEELSRLSSARTSCMGGWEGASNGQICGKGQRKKEPDVCLVRLVSPQVKPRDDYDNASVSANRFRLWEGC